MSGSTSSYKLTVTYSLVIVLFYTLIVRFCPLERGLDIDPGLQSSWLPVRRYQPVVINVQQGNDSGSDSSIDGHVHLASIKNARI